MIKLYIDENLSPFLAKGLHYLEQGNGNQIEVLSIREVFGRSTEDEVWIPEIGKEGGIVLTQDYNIFRKKSQRLLYEQCNVGLFIIRPSSKRRGYNYWEMVVYVINQWSEMRKLAMSDLPFAYICNARGKFEKIS